MSVFTGRKKQWLSIAIVTLLVLLTALFFLHRRVQDHSGVLWKFVSQQCVPDMEKNNNPAPCKKVDMAGGYVLFKDLVGPLQYLLMPVNRITGIESPLLLKPETPHFFLAAWRERHLLSETYHAPIPDDDLAMTINSASGRSQNQLHIHMSCLRPDIAAQLAKSSSGFGPEWQKITLLSHPYQVRTLSQQELEQESVFIRVAHEIPGASGHMGDYGLALTALPDGRLVLLAVKAALLKGNTGSAEELQDHQCSILKTVSGA
ncbi:MULTISPECIES: CDP-diacylglycerol diphosphatase [Tatumella]|uniref:CDP-diacylglycerol diphosphatase n=1 Tax=Tatumella TaxID=82986 RepID=UPI0006855BF2|nr:MULTISPECIES: CDP-diacylglycerol diphosphatase [Tatumella]